MSDQLIKQALIIMSGKGGVGKSSITTQMAFSLESMGKKVGVLDIDICGPSLARMFNVENKQIVQSQNGWLPVKIHDKNIYLISMAFLITDKNSAVIWRGPRKHGMIERFITGVDWQQLDYLLIDTPPGTSDEHISLIELMLTYNIPFKAIMVTSPQIVACNDVRREISFCRTSNVEIAGVIENMSGYICPHCGTCTKIFSSQGGQHLSQLNNLRFLGSVPLEPKLCRSTEQGISFLDAYKDSNTAGKINDIVNKVITA